MMTLKHSLAIAITIVLTVIAYIISSAQLLPTLQSTLPSIFVLLTFGSFLCVSLVFTPNFQSAASSNPESGDSDDMATLYVGNLAYKANEKTVQDYFTEIGNVRSVRLVKDKRTGRRKGFGFVEIDKRDENKFIKKLNESLFMERNIIVRPANEKQH